MGCTRVKKRVKNGFKSELHALAPVLSGLYIYKNNFTCFIPH